MSIPKIVHQTWKRRRLPRALARYRASWRKRHPDWEFRLWTDRHNRRFIERHYPGFLAQFDAYPHPIQRADAVRYFLLHHFGGLYIDLDFLCLKAIDPLLAGQNCVLGLEPTEHCREFQVEQIVCNALMAATPSHPFFAHLIDQLPRYAQRSDTVQPVLETTGPFMLTNVYAESPARDSVALLPSQYFYPLTREQGDVFRETGRAPISLHAAYAVHLHLGTWWRKDPLEHRPIRDLRRRLTRWPRRLIRAFTSRAA
jgi:inositol phosphorylceramide mannosyltransferase catalytic subunit